MQIEEIRKNAPDGATHYLGTEKIRYFKKSGLKWSIYLSNNREWWSDYKDCHDIYWFFGWWYGHKFSDTSYSRLKPL